VPTRCMDVFAWCRTVLSPAGPSSPMRLVLVAMSQSMDPDGSNCWVGVRALAQATRFNKDTVAKHRALAVKQGWLLISFRPGHTRFPSFAAAIPDGIEVFIRKASNARRTLGRRGSVSRLVGCSLSDGFGRRAPALLSEGLGQSENRLSEMTHATVRNDACNCPNGSDLPLIPIVPLKSATTEASVQATTTETESKSQIEEANKERFNGWIRSENFAQLYHLSPKMLVKLTPPNCRFPGYETLIQEATERTRKR
jgi:hypothetical protein